MRGDGVGEGVGVGSDGLVGDGTGKPDGSGIGATVGAAVGEAVGETADGFKLMAGVCCAIAKANMQVSENKNAPKPKVILFNIKFSLSF